MKDPRNVGLIVPVLGVTLIVVTLFLECGPAGGIFAIVMFALLFRFCS